MSKTKKHIAELEEALAKERNLRLKAESEVQLKAGLLAVIGHELKTPLSGIISIANLLRVSELRPLQQQYADGLSVSAKNLLMLLENLLDQSKQQNGFSTLNIDTFSPRFLLEEQFEVLNHRAAEKGLAAALEITGHLPNQLRGDQVKVRQVLNNLTDNALRFTDHGSINLRVENVLSAENHILLRFEVTDTGSGISELDRHCIFEPYQQGNETTCENHGGTGLGLWIVNDLIQFMHGEFGFEANMPTGCVFWFTLRFEISNKQVQSQKLQQLCKPNILSGHALIVDDNHVNQKIIETYLSNLGMTSIIAGSGYEALQQLTRNEFDLVLLDLKMPGMDGFETAKKIRILDRQCSRLPIIAITADTMNISHTEFAESQIDGCISKPIDPQKLLTEISRFLSPEIRRSYKSA